MTDTALKKFMYGDDVALITQATSFQQIESVMNADLAKILPEMAPSQVKSKQISNFHFLLKQPRNQ